MSFHFTFYILCIPAKSPSAAKYVRVQQSILQVCPIVFFGFDEKSNLGFRADNANFAIICAFDRKTSEKNRWYHC